MHFENDNVWPFFQIVKSMTPSGSTLVERFFHKRVIIESDYAIACSQLLGEFANYTSSGIALSFEYGRDHLFQKKTQDMVNHPCMIPRCTGPVATSDPHSLLIHSPHFGILVSVVKQLLNCY